VTKRLLIGLVTVAALTGCGGAVTEAHQTPEREAAATSAVSVTSPAPGPASVPTRMQLSGIDSPVVPAEMEGSSLTPPADPTVLGWWGQKAGAKRGATLLIGHTVHTGGGDLDNLEDIKVGSTATVNGHTYQVTSNEVLSKEAVARHAKSLFSQTGEHRLVVVTCEDYDPATGHYQSNVVLVAEQVV
jgi:hypothetical protein